MRDRIRERRRLAVIARHLAAEDPRLVEAFQLWNERCNGRPDDPARVWALGSTLRAAFGRLLR